MKQYIIITHIPYEGCDIEIIEEKELNNKLVLLKKQELGSFPYFHEVFELGERIYITC